MATYSTSALKLGAWNIDGLFSRISNIRTSKLDFEPVNRLLRNLDIFCLTETHCGTSDIINLDGFHVEQNFRPRSKNSPHAFGGLAVGVKLQLMKGVKFLKPTHSEFMWFKLNKQFFGLDNDIYICSVYISPSGSSYSQRRDDIFSLIEKEIVTFSKMGSCILIGDFNARTCKESDFVVNDTCKYLNVHSDYVLDTFLTRYNNDTKSVDSHGKLLLDLCKSSGLRIVNGRKLGDFHGNFTCFNHRGNPSVIDYMLCHLSVFKDIEYFKVHVLNPYSIHCMISCVIKTNWVSHAPVLDNDIPLHEFPNHFTWTNNSAALWGKAVNHPDIQSEINKVMNMNSDEITVDNHITAFNNLFCSIGNVAGLRRKNGTVNKRLRHTKNKQWFDQDCKTLYKKIRSISRLIKSQPLNLTLVHEYRSLRKCYKKLLNKKSSLFRAKIFHQLDTLQSNDPKAFWKLYEELGDKKPRVKNPIAPKQWLNHFITLMNRNIQHTDKNVESMIDHFVSGFNYDSSFILDNPFTNSEIIKAVRSLKNGKAPGIDGIRNEMLKVGTYPLAQVLTNLFNVILVNGIFPTSWRLSTLTVLHKKGDKTNPKNYRGIAVSSNLCKLFCSVLHNRLVKFVDDNSIIPSNQIGFRKGSRTSDHILVLKTLIDKYIHRASKSYLYVCFVDFSAAFDTVWRNALLYKLFKIGIRGNFLHIIQDMYASVSFTVKCDGKLTDNFDTSVGVKQGCILSPMFFNIYLSDLTEIFDDSCDPVQLNNSPLSCLMYADDLILLSDSAQGLQCALDKLQSYCQKWKLLVNIDKSNVMIFNKSGRVLTKHIFKYGDCILKITNEYCYLGIIFTPSGSFTKAMCRLKDKALKAYFKVRDNLISNSSHTSFKLFQTLIQPILTYGCEVWAPYLLKNLNDCNFLNICDKVPSETLHIKVCKLILGVFRKASNAAVRGELGSFPLLIPMLSLAIKYWWKLNKLCASGQKSLVIDALLENRKLDLTHTFTWSSGIKSMFQLIDKPDVWNKPNLITKVNFDDCITSSIKSVYSSLWFNHISLSQPKLRTYCQFKKSFAMENYVKAFNRSSRSMLCKLRISAHQLMIERGRYTSPKIDINDRLCNYCDLHEVEDEFHFIMKCKLYNVLRDQLFHDVSDIYNISTFDINSLSNDDIFKFIMSANDYDTLKIVTCFVNSCFTTRSSSTSSTTV